MPLRQLEAEQLQARRSSLEAADLRGLKTCFKEIVDVQLCHEVLELLSFVYDICEFRRIVDELFDLQLTFDELLGFQLGSN